MATARPRHTIIETDDVARALRDAALRWLPDCCVLLAAEAVGGAVLTFDERLVRQAARLSLDS